MENVVQVVTSHSIYTPCIAHCLDLVLKDNGKIDRVKKVVDEGKSITKYTITHGHSIL